MASVQNTLIVIDDTTISANINPAFVAELREASKATGMSLSRILNRAIDNWLETEGPVYMAEAEEKRRQRV